MFELSLVGKEFYLCQRLKIKKQEATATEQYTPSQMEKALLVRFSSK